MDLSTLKVYGYIVGVQLLALFTYMASHVHEPKNESYWLGAAILLLNGLLSWGGRSPSNAIKRWQAPRVKDIANKGAGDRSGDPNEES